MYDTFTLTNVLPERKKNTMWNAVEVYVREKVLKDFKDVRIFAGPMFRVADSQTVTYRVSLFLINLRLSSFLEYGFKSSNAE